MDIVDVPDPGAEIVAGLKPTVTPLRLARGGQGDRRGKPAIDGGRDL